MVMSDRFEMLVDIVLAHEGGLVTKEEAVQRGDPGGETNFGISKRAHPDVDIANLTVDDAKGIYYIDYYSHYMDEFYSARVALMLFDFGVNAGVSRATRFMQEVVGTAPDGKLGSKTLDAINGYDIRKLIRDYGVKLGIYYCEIGNETFLFGWFKRLMDNMTRNVV